MTGNLSPIVRGSVRLLLALAAALLVALASAAGAAVSAFSDRSRRPQQLRRDEYRRRPVLGSGLRPQAGRRHRPERWCVEDRRRLGSQLRAHQPGGVKCWGSNFGGALGGGADASGTTPVDVVGLTSGVSAVAVGEAHSCALTGAGGVKCWGFNLEGQVGDGTTSNRSTPVAVSGLQSGVTAIATGSYHSCALTGKGGVECWGDAYGSTPLKVPGLQGGVIAITAGFGHSCALTSGGGVKCWGSNGEGQLGDGTTSSARRRRCSRPQQRRDRDRRGRRAHLCAHDLGRRRVLGRRFPRRARRRNVDFRRPLDPVGVIGLSSGVTAITVGVEHSCALLNTGDVKCWGRDDFGQLGDQSACLRPVDTGRRRRLRRDRGDGIAHACVPVGKGLPRACGGDRRALRSRRRLQGHAHAAEVRQQSLRDSARPDSARCGEAVDARLQAAPPGQAPDRTCVDHLCAAVRCFHHGDRHDHARRSRIAARARASARRRRARCPRPT